MSENSRSPVTRHTIWTIGHSNRSVEQLLSMLQESSIELVADVRRFPGSRRSPQFAQQNLERSLQTVKIAYRHFPDLGGRRRTRIPDSPNTGWRVESFNAYADYMVSPEFQQALVELEKAAAAQNAAMMCAEAVPWRCHRRLIADVLLTHGWEVLDIYSEGRVKPHALTEFARVEGLRVTYPADPSPR